MTRQDDAVLCYVRGGCAWFTTQPLDQQWGDDWDDAPYEHNAGDPYSWRPEKWVTGVGQVPNDELRYELFEVFWLGPWVTPDDGQLNSRWSVDQINAGAVAWLTPDRWFAKLPAARPIRAGVTMAEFRRLIWAGGGRVFEETTPDMLERAADAVAEALG